MIDGNAGGDIAEKGGLSCFWWRHDQASGAKANGAEQVDHPRGDGAALMLKGESGGGINWNQVLK